MVLYAPVAAVLVAAGREEEMVVGLVAVLAFTLAPDVDAPLPGIAHRGITHSLLAAGCLGTVAGLVGWASAPLTVDRIEYAAFGSLLGSLGVLSHLLGDVITPMGVRLFFPVNPQAYTLDLVRASNPETNLAMLAVGIAVLCGTVRWQRVRIAARGRRDPLGRQTPDDHRGVRSDGSGQVHSLRLDTGERNR